MHQFLFHHFYEVAIARHGMSKHMASLGTFFLSSCMHEFVMAVVCQRVSFYLFFLQMLQVPLIYLGRSPALQRHPVLCNLFFCASMVVGPALLTLLYCRDNVRAATAATA